ncbi:hypothetical protein [Pseudomonas promysalinigenes]|uniref:Uncharacterized protein n=1 Tax=Pseudomonas promysalinigenes TaxID=485898 RepID=A0ABY6AGQ2_9PSED|nr:hypothetical protein [Pseudomonas promysalinigenes]UXH38806.1 hypothetical protein N5C08_17780 [Pseudomonas promysalinigenes]
MTSSKPRKSSSSFKAVKSFNFPGGLESYNAAVKLEPSGLVNTWSHDFRVAYTLIQAVQVATSLSYSLIYLAKQRRSIETQRKLEHRIACWSGLIAPYMSEPKSGIDEMYSDMSGERFIGHGTFHDPDPLFEFDDAKDAVYDLAIIVEDGVVIMKFGWVAWMLDPSEAEWLADQLWTAAFLAAKHPAHC